MKKLSLFLASAMMFFACATIQAQDQKEKQRPSKEEMMQMRCQKMKQKLMLDDNTAAKFESTYKDYLNAMDACRLHNGGKGRVKGEKPKEPQNLTDSQIDEMTKEGFAQQRKMIDVKEKYYGEFRQFLTAQQASTIVRDEQRPMDRRGNGKHGDRKQMKENKAQE